MKTLEERLKDNLEDAKQELTRVKDIAQGQAKYGTFRIGEVSRIWQLEYFILRAQLVLDDTWNKPQVTCCGEAKQ